MTTKAARDNHLRNLFQDIIRGERIIRRTNGALFIEAIANQSEPLSWVTMTTRGEAIGLSSISSALAFVASLSHLNGVASDFLLYLRNEDMRSTGNQQHLVAVVKAIMNSTVFWPALLHAFRWGELTEKGQLAFTFLLLQLLRLENDLDNLNPDPYYRSVAENPDILGRLLNQTSEEGRSLAAQIKAVVTGTHSEAPPPVEAPSISPTPANLEDRMESEGNKNKSLTERSERRDPERKVKDEEEKDRKIKEVREAWERRKKDEDEERQRKRKQKEKGEQLKEEEEERTAAEKKRQEEEETRRSSFKAPEKKEKSHLHAVEDEDVENQMAPTTNTKAEEASATSFEKVAPAWGQWFCFRRGRATEENKLHIAAASPEMVDRKITSLLNKLTMENFDSIADQIIRWANKSETEKDGRTLVQVIRLIFQRAIDEATWSEMYARLCRRMMQRLSSRVQDHGIRNAQGKPITGGQLFRRYLLNRCQEYFERGWFSEETTSIVALDMVALDQGAEEVNKSTDAGSVELYSNEYYAAQKAKRRGLGLVKFIGELFRLQMLTERIMHECVKKLLSNIDQPEEEEEEEEIESLCTLLTTIGAILDTNKVRAHMDIYFARMERLKERPNVGLRIQFILQDVIELREHKWVLHKNSSESNALASAHKQFDIPGGAYNHRPLSLSAPPITIYHSVFTKFLSIMDITLEKLQLSNEELDNALGLMAAVEIYPQIDCKKSGLLFNRRRAALSSLENAVRMNSYRWTTTLLEGEGTLPLKSYSRIPCPRLLSNSLGLGVAIVVSNEVGNDHSDALTHAEREYEAAIGAEEYRIVRDMSCCPALLIGVAGAYLTVTGFIFTDSHISQRLTPDYIYIGPRPGTGGRSGLEQGIRKIAQVLRAIRVTLDSLDKFYRSLTSPSGLSTSDGPSAWGLHRGFFPPHFQTYSDGKETFRLEYLERLASNDPETAVFKARSEGLTSQSESTAVVKFTHNYSEEGHKLLESISLAPPLRFCQRVEDVGMLVVIMDFAEGKCVENRVRGASRIQSLRKGLRALHEKDLVFGDLRAENVLVSQSDEVILVDFDWCGRADVARYPHYIELDADIGWHKDVRRGGRIEKEHDAYLFQALTGEPL